MNWTNLLDTLFQGIANFTPGNLVMIAVGGVLIYLAIVKEYEPVLLLPIGAGAILANIPLTGMTDAHGVFGILKAAGIDNEMFPLLIFIGVVVWVFRPGSRRKHRDAAESIFRNENRPAPDSDNEGDDGRQ